MESFHWDNNFVTGLAEIDRQHHQLVDVINLFGSLLAKNSLVATDLETTLQRLAEYARYHFQEEEKLMASIGVDQRHLDSQISAHRGFFKEVGVMHEAITADNPQAARRLLDFLTHWLAYHILGSDQNMARQIKAIKAGASPSGCYEAEGTGDNNATGPLLAALNSLFLQVSERNKELVQLNRSLEAKVQERTKALSEANLHLEELALTDVLTGIPNRRHAMRCLAELWAESVQNNTPLACMMIDADHFKAINDKYGHDAGDVVLCELAKKLQHAFRNDDIVCRLGGDEFLVVCPDTDLGGALHIAELACRAVGKLHVAAGDGYWQGSVSIGVADRTPEITSYDKLIAAADRAVYLAKQDGKNCVRTK